jgi:hypothetical protein
MYDLRSYSQVEEDSDSDIMEDTLIMMTMLEEIVNYQMLQVKMGKKDGIKGILLAISCRFINPFYRVKYDKDLASMSNNKAELNQGDKTSKSSAERLKTMMKRNEIGIEEKRKEVLSKSFDEQKNNKNDKAADIVIWFGLILLLIDVALMIIVIILEEIGIQIPIESDKIISVITWIGFPGSTIMLIGIVASRFIHGS